MTQNFRSKGSSPIKHSCPQKTRLNDILYGIKIWTDLSSILSQCTRLAERLTNGQTEFSSLDKVCIPSSAVKIRSRGSKVCYLVTSFQQPGYLADLISPYSQSRLLRSSTQKLLSFPPHNLDTVARRFSVAAPRLWNSLPLNCRTAPSVNTFKIRLKTFFFDLT